MVLLYFTIKEKKNSLKKLK